MDKKIDASYSGIHLGIGCVQCCTVLCTVYMLHIVVFSVAQGLDCVVFSVAQGLDCVVFSVAQGLYCVLHRD